MLVTDVALFNKSNQKGAPKLAAKADIMMPSSFSKTQESVMHWHCFFGVSLAFALVFSVVFFVYGWK